MALRPVFGNYFTRILDLLTKGLKKTKLDKSVKILNEKVKKLEEDNTGLTCDLAAEKENEKKAYDQTVFDDIYTTLTKLPDFDFMVFRPEAVEMANAFGTMSPTIAELANGTRKVVDYSNALAI
ncbi:hypothetical protein CsatA_014947 [Cannabis sativa]